MPVEIMNKEIIRAIELAYDVQNPQGKISEEKKVIKKIFNQTKDIDDKEILRLAVINGIYSTRASISIMISLSEAIKRIESNDLKLKELFKKYFEHGQQEKFIMELFRGKYGDKENHAWSLISKYAYFLTDFEFPIYDEFIRNTLHFAREEKHIESDRKILKSHFESGKSENIHYYFQYIHKLSQSLYRDLGENTIDKLDAFGWVTEKLKRGQKFDGWDKKKLPELKKVLKKLKLIR